MVTQSHLANEDDKEVSTEGDVPLGFIPNAMSPMQPWRRSKSSGFRVEAFAVMFVFFMHISY